MIEPVLAVWWFRPVLSALRVGEHSAVVWKLLKRRPDCGQLVHGGRADGPAERAGPAEADVVDQHDHDIGGACGRLDLEPRRWLDLARVQFAIRRSCGLRDGQDRAIELRLRRHRRGGDGQREAKHGKGCHSLHGFLPLSVHRMQVDGVAHITSATSPGFQRSSNQGCGGE